MKKNNSIDRTALMPNYAPAEFIPVKGKKSILWDDKGKNNQQNYGMSAIIYSTSRL